MGGDPCRSHRDAVYGGSPRLQGWPSVSDPDCAVVDAGDQLLHRLFTLPGIEHAQLLAEIDPLLVAPDTSSNERVDLRLCVTPLSNQLGRAGRR